MFNTKIHNTCRLAYSSHCRQIKTPVYNNRKPSDYLVCLHRHTWWNHSWQPLHRMLSSLKHSSLGEHCWWQTGHKTGWYGGCFRDTTAAFWQEVCNSHVSRYLLCLLGKCCWRLIWCQESVNVSVWWSASTDCSSAGTTNVRQKRKHLSRIFPQSFSSKSVRSKCCPFTVYTKKPQYFSAVTPICTSIWK